MDDTVRRFVKLKEQVEEAQQEATRAEGALSQLMETLKTEFGCKSLADAKEKLGALQEKEQRQQRKLERAMDTFEEDWADKL